MPMRKWKIKPIFALGTLLVLLGGLLVAYRLAREEGPMIVAYVDGEPIYEAELQRSMAQQRHAVAMHYYHTYGMEEMPGFWDNGYGEDRAPESPIKHLRMKALQSAVGLKLQQMLARDKGLVDEISYPAFIANWKSENERRKEAVKQNEAIYGPLQYTEEAYFEYVTANMQLQLEGRLAGQEIPLSEALLEQYYEAWKEEYYKGAGAVQVYKIRISYLGENGSADSAKREAALAMMQGAIERLAQGEGFTRLAAELNETKEERESYGWQTFDQTTAREDQVAGGALREAALMLEEGQASGLIDTNNALYLLYGLGREPAQYRPFDQMRQDVKSKYIRHHYSLYFQRQAELANVELVDARYHAVALP